MAKILWACFLLLIPIVSAGYMNHTCVRDYVKMGCFNERAEGMTLIVNDRDRTHPSFDGHILDWNNFKQSIRSLACRCSKKAKEGKYQYFAIRFYAECWAGKNVSDINLDPDHKKNNCINGLFKTCDKSREHECVGTVYSEYIYVLKDKGRDVNGGYSDWTEWTNCSSMCGAGIIERERSCTKPKPQGEGKDCSELGESTEVKTCNKAACYVSCEEDDVDYTGNDIKQYTNTDSWEICSSHCRDLPTCNAWTWLTETFSHAEKRKECLLKSNDKGRRKLSGTVSGPRTCGETESCEENGVDYNGHDIKQYPNTTSWKICGAHCRQNAKCVAWTFTTKEFPVVGKRMECFLKNGDDGRKSQTGTISGSRFCGKTVNGEWGQWSSYDDCTKECGGGLQERSRRCDNPSPFKGGLSCVGPDTQAQECNTNKCPVPCEENNVDYTGYDIKQYPNTDSWEICSSHCRDLPTCNAWTWLTETFSHAEKRKECLLKSNEKGRRNLSGTISGSRKCGKTDSCEEKGVDYSGHDIKPYPNTDSWQICSSHCRDLAACTAWTWLTESFPIVKRRKECFLKNGKDGRISLTGTISGSRNCGKAVP